MSDECQPCPREENPKVPSPVSKRSQRALAKFEEHQKLWRPLYAKGLPVIFDFAYDDLMTDKQRTSLAKEMKFALGYERRSAHPLQLMFCGVQQDSNGVVFFRNSPDVHLNTWSVHITPSPLEAAVVLRSDPSERSTDPSEQKKAPDDMSLWTPHREARPRSPLPAIHRLVYLTPDCHQPLLRLDSTESYVIGALVDKGHAKFVSAARCQALDDHFQVAAGNTPRPPPPREPSPDEQANSYLSRRVDLRAASPPDYAGQLCVPRRLPFDEVLSAEECLGLGALASNHISEILSNAVQQAAAAGFGVDGGQPLASFAIDWRAAILPAIPKRKLDQASRNSLQHAHHIACADQLAKDRAVVAAVIRATTTGETLTKEESTEI